ncbi:hypothetical protein [Clostridium tetani]|nr:hypothetical protein [Clostridium tetani]BDR75254.1 hypothetical protein K154306013_09140 [Clostridium tetani]CDI49158.1 hypothetical protein BN906_01151 [Clostridium tetani 12124569]
MGTIYLSTMSTVFTKGILLKGDNITIYGILSYFHNTHKEKTVVTVDKIS